VLNDLEEKFKDEKDLKFSLKLVRKQTTMLKNISELVGRDNIVGDCKNLLGQNRIDLAEEEIFRYLTEEFKP